MILCSTIRKLAAKGATVYRVDVPAHTATVGTIVHSTEGTSQHFATRKGAEDYAQTLNGQMRLFAKGETCTITPVPAASLDPFFTW